MRNFFLFKTSQIFRNIAGWADNDFLHRGALVAGAFVLPSSSVDGIGFEVFSQKKLRIMSVYCSLQTVVGALPLVF